MDLPRDPRAEFRRRWWRRAAALVAAGVAVTALRPAALGGLERLGEAGVRWLLPPEAAEAATEPIRGAPISAGSGTPTPGTSRSGSITIPPEYAEWVLVGTATGLSYSEGVREGGDHGAPGAFTQVYLEPSAYRSYLDRGEFPEGTTFVLEIREPTSGVSIARGGWFAGRLRGVHAAVKHADPESDWGYYDVAADGSTTGMGPSCARCHARHGAVDNVFVQFYPRLQAAER